MSDQPSDTESDITRAVEKQILHRPVSVSCEARTPRASYNGNGSAGGQSDGLKQNGTGKSKRGKMLEKGKMEIFQIMSDLDPMSQINKKTEESRSERSAKQAEECHTTKNYSTTESTIQKSDVKETQIIPKLEIHTLNESNLAENCSTQEKSSAQEHRNRDIYERLQALETSLSALTPRSCADDHMGAYLQRQNKPTHFTKYDPTQNNGRNLADVSFQSDDFERMISPAAATPRLEHPANTSSCQNKPGTDYAFFLKDSSLSCPPVGTVSTHTYGSNLTSGYLRSPGNMPCTTTGYLHNPGNVSMSSTQCLPNPGNLPNISMGYPQPPGNVPVLSTGYLQNPGNLPSTGNGFLHTPASYQSNTSVEIPRISSNSHNHGNHQPMRNGNPSYVNTGRIQPQSITSKGTQPPYAHSQGNKQFESFAQQEGYKTKPADLKTDTQTLLYQLQQDMISREREYSLMFPNTQPDSSTVFYSANQHGQSDLNQSGALRSQFPVSQSEALNIISPTDQSKRGDVSQCSQQLQHQEQHCSNCNSKTMTPVNFTNHHSNRLDFTQPEASANLTLLVDATRLYIHKEVMSAWSNRWRHLVHVNSASGDQIVLRDTKLQTVLHLLQFVYGIHKVVTDANVYSLLELGDKFEMPKIKSECEVFLLAKESSLKLLVAAQNFRLQQLYKKCLETVTRQDLHSLERNPLFSQLNATTTASIYKAEILRLRSVARASEQNQMKTQMQARKLRNKKEKVSRRLEEVGEQWKTNRNRCFKHGVHVRSDFDFSCTECNKRVQHQIKKLCGESETVQDVGLDNVSLISDDVTGKEY